VYAPTAITLPLPRLYSNNNLEVSNLSSVSGTSDQAEWTQNLSNGIYIWNCLVNDTYGNFDWGINRTLIINLSSATNTLNNTTPINNTLNESVTIETDECVIGDWDCTEWKPSDSCPSSGERTRTCTLIGDCEGGVTPEETEPCEPKSFGTAAIIVSIIFIVLIIGGIILYFYFNKSNLDNMSENQTTNSQIPPRPPMNPGMQGGNQNSQQPQRFY